MFIKIKMGFNNLPSKVASYLTAAYLIFSYPVQAQEPLRFGVGKTTSLEERLNVDVVGDFSVEETSKFAEVVDSVKSAYPSVIDRINVAVDRSEYPWKSSSYVNATDSRFKQKIDLISVNYAKDADSFNDGPLWSFKDNFAHELGHLITTKYINLSQYGCLETKTDSLFLASIKNLPEDKIRDAIKNRRASQKLRQSFLYADSIAPPINFENKDRQVGYVSLTADLYRYLNKPNDFSQDSLVIFSKSSSRIKVSKEESLEEDIAETFAYIVNGHHYADADSLVQEKIKAIDEFIRVVYQENK